MLFLAKFALTVYLVWFSQEDLIIKEVCGTPSNALRYFKSGDIVIGGLIAIHAKSDGNLCDKFDNAGFGFSQVLAYTIERINQDPNLLPNVTMGYDIRDYCRYPLRAIADAYDFVENFPDNRVVAVIGPEDSSTALKVVGLLHVKKIPVVSFSASSEELSNPMFSNFFRTIPPDVFQAKAIADLIDYFNWTYVATIAVDDSYGRYGSRALEREANKRLTFCIAFIEYVTKTGYKNKIKDIVNKLKRDKHIKTVVLWATEMPSRRFLAEALTQGLFDRTFIISDSLATNDLKYFEKYSQVLKGCFGMIPIYEKFSEYKGFMKKATPRSTNNSEVWRVFWEHEFSCSFQRSPSKTSCKVYNDQFMSNNTLASTYNAFGSKIVDAVYAIAYALHEVNRCATETPVRPPCSNLSNYMEPLEVIRFLHNVSFKGRSGRTKFDSMGNPLFSWYNIINVQILDRNRIVKKVVGKWNETIEMNNLAIKWTDHTPTVSVCHRACPPGTRKIPTTRCCWKCSECEDSVSQGFNSMNCTKCGRKQKPNDGKTECEQLPLENTKLLSSPASICLLVLSVLGLFITVAACIIFLRIWTTPIVKASNRELSCVLFVAILISFVVAILHLNLPSSVLCLVFSPLHYVLNSVCVTVLFLKTERLLRAFTPHIAQPARKCVSKGLRFGRSPFVGVALLNFVQLILAILSIMLDPAVIQETIKPGQSIIVRCLPYQTIIGKALDITMLSYLVLLVLISTLYSFKARKIPENYNEGRCIVFSLYVIILSWIVYYPVHFSLDGGYVAVVSSASTLLGSYGLLVCIFFPKLYVIFFHPEKNTVEYARAQIKKHTMAKSSVVIVKDMDAQGINITNTCISPSPNQCSEGVSEIVRSHVS